MFLTRLRAHAAVAVIGLVVCASSSVSSSQSPKPAAVLMQAAAAKATIEGDFKGAAALYDEAAARALAEGNRALAADALVGAGEAYRALSDARADERFARVVREFADQPGAVSRARPRLGQDSREPLKGTALVLSGSGERDLNYARVSHDGRYVVFDKWASPSLDLWLHDFQTGQDRRLTNSAARPGSEQQEFSLFRRAFSRDGRHLAYAWYTTSRPASPGGGLAIQLRIASLDGRGLLKPRPPLVDTDEIDWIEPHGWDPTGKWIVVTLQRADGTGQIALVSTETGERHVLRSFEWRGEFEMSLSPDGRFLAFDVRPPATSARDIDVMEVDYGGAHPVVVRNIPVVVYDADDALIGWSPDGKQLLFASERMGSRGLYAQAFEQGTPVGAARLVKPGMPEFEVAGLTSAGALYYRERPPRLSDVKVARIDFGTGAVLAPPADIQAFAGTNANPAWSHDGRLLAYISERRGYPARGRVLVIRSVDTDNVREFRPLELNAPVLGPLRWSGDDRALTIEALSHSGHGGFFRIDAATGQTTVLGRTGREPRGMFHPAYTLSPDGRTVFYRQLAPGQIDRPATSARIFDLIERDLASGRETALLQAAGNSPVGQQGSGYRLSDDGKTLYYRRPARAGDGTEAPTFAGEGAQPLYELVARDLNTEKDRVLVADQWLGLGSPNGRYQLRPSNEAGTRTLRLVDLHDHTERELMRNPSAEQTAPVMWAPDSASILVRRNHDVWWVPIDGRAPRKLEMTIDFSRGPLSDIVVHPDGQRVAFTQRENHLGLHTVDLMVLKSFLPAAAAGANR